MLVDLVIGQRRSMAVRSVLIAGLAARSSGVGLGSLLGEGGGLAFGLTLGGFEGCGSIHRRASPEPFHFLALGFHQGQEFVVRGCHPALAVYAGIVSCTELCWFSAGTARVGAKQAPPAFMAPEQARGETVDARSDLFSLGCILYELAGGTRPFDAPSTMAALSALVAKDPQPLHEIRSSLPADLSDLVMGLLAKDPERRPGSAQEVVTRPAGDRSRAWPKTRSRGRPRRRSVSRPGPGRGPA